MSRYQGIDCPVCHKPLREQDEVVVCPECGAPYHKTCYLEAGACQFPHLHAEGKAWEAPRFEPKVESSDRVCSRCGSRNGAGAMFCQVCGTPLTEEAAWQQPRNDFGMPHGGGMPLNPFINPFGGVDPEEEIDELPAKDLAIFVGPSSHYFLPIFKKLAFGSGRRINWPAFLFQGYYFLYRKMYGLGVATLIITFLLGLPGLYVTMLSVMGSEMPFVLPLTEQALAQLMQYTSIAAIALRFGLAFFCNSIYKWQTYRKIRRLQAKNLPQEEYSALLAKKGRVATKLMGGLAIGYLVVNFLMMAASSLFFPM